MTTYLRADSKLPALCKLQCGVWATYLIGSGSMVLVMRVEVRDSFEQCYCKVYAVDERGGLVSFRLDMEDDVTIKQLIRVQEPKV